MRHHRHLSPVERRPSTASAFQYHLQQPTRPAIAERWSLELDHSQTESATISPMRSPTHLSHTTPVIHVDALEQARERKSQARPEPSERQAKSGRSGDHTKRHSSGGRDGDDHQRSRSERHDRSPRHLGQVADDSASDLTDRRSAPPKQRRGQEKDSRKRRPPETRPQEATYSDAKDFSVEWQKDEVEEKRMEEAATEAGPAPFRSGDDARDRERQEGEDERERGGRRREARDQRENRKRREGAEEPAPHALRSDAVDESSDSDRRRRRRQRKEREKLAEREREEREEQLRQKEERTEHRQAERSWEEELDGRRNHHQRPSSPRSERSILTPAPHTEDGTARSPRHHRTHSPHSNPPHSAGHLRRHSPSSPRPSASTVGQHSGSHSHSFESPQSTQPSITISDASHSSHSSHSHPSHTSHPHSHHSELHSGYQTEPIHSHVDRDGREREKAPPTDISAAERLLAEVEALKCPSCSHHFRTPHSHPPAPTLTPSTSAPTALSGASLPQPFTSSTTPSHHHQHHHTHVQHHHHHHNHLELSSPLSLTSRLPRLLSCGHTLCTSCLTASLPSSSPPSPVLPCPLGCTSTVMKADGKEGVLTIDLNEPVMSLLGQLKGEGRRAHGRSIASSTTLHLDRHLQSDGPPSIFCDQHPTHPLTLYCIDCSMLICLACTSPLFTDPEEARPMGALGPSTLSTAEGPATSLALPSSHRGHSWRKKEAVHLEWRQSSLQSSLLHRLSSEREALQSALGHLSRRLRAQREREAAEVKAVDDAFTNLQQQLLALLRSRQLDMTSRLHQRHLHTQLHLEAQRRTLATELNDLHLLSIKADWMGQVRAERRVRRREEMGLGEGGRVNGLTVGEVVREEEEVDEMRWISDLLRTIQLERKTRAQVAEGEMEEREEKEQGERVRVRAEVGEVVDVVRQGLQRFCVVVDHVPLTVAFVVARVVEREGRAGEVELRWQAGGEDAVTEWHVEVQQTRKPMDADRTKGRTGRKHQKQPRDAEEEEPLALAGLSELHGPTSPSPSTSSSVPFLPLYSGSGQSCTHPLALDVSYTFRVRGVNAVGHSAFCYSPPLSAATRLLAFNYPNDHCGLAHHCAHPLRVLTSTLHPASSPPSQLLHPSEGTAVATLPRVSSTVLVDCGVAVVLSCYVLWDVGRVEWRRRGMVRWRLWGSVDDREWGLIEERGRGERSVGGGGGGDGESRLCVDVRGCGVYAVDVEKSRHDGRGYRYLKWEQLGTNADDDHSLVLGGVELYGLIPLEQHRAT